MSKQVIINLPVADLPKSVAIRNGKRKPSSDAF
jgi:hypothetical protein